MNLKVIIAFLVIFGTALAHPEEKEEKVNKGQNNNQPNCGNQGCLCPAIYTEDICALEDGIDNSPQWLSFCQFNCKAEQCQCGGQQTIRAVDPCTCPPKHLQGNECMCNTPIITTTVASTTTTVVPTTSIWF